MKLVYRISYFNAGILFANGSGLVSGTVDYVMLFNILHHEEPLELLNEAYKLLCEKGKVGIIHWRTYIETPRGPDMSIRPKPEQCITWAKKSGIHNL